MILTTQMHIDPSVIDLGVGQPQLSLLPLQRIRQAAERRFSQGDPSFLQYGAEQGDGYLRQELAKFLSQGYGFAVSAENLFITNGASMGLDLVCTLFAQAGEAVFVEEPSYFLALRILADHRLRPVAIPVDENGLVPEAVEAELKRKRPAFLYTIPTFQNPSGYTLSQERRQKLAALSREYDFWIVADEVYHFLHYTAQPPRAFAGYTAEGKILSLGSFSKILAPGLRLGWIHTDAARANSFAHSGLLDSGGGMNPFTSALIRGLLESSEFDTNLQELRQVYAARVAAMDHALRLHIPDAGYQTPQGGYFFWVRLPDDKDAEALMAQAEKYKVSFRPGVRFSSRGELRHFARLCFAYYEADQLVQGIERLKQALEG